MMAISSNALPMFLNKTPIDKMMMEPRITPRNASKSSMTTKEDTSPRTARILKNTDIAFIVRSGFDRSAIHRIVAGVPH